MLVAEPWAVRMLIDLDLAVFGGFFTVPLHSLETARRAYAGGRREQRVERALHGGGSVLLGVGLHFELSSGRSSCGAERSGGGVLFSSRFLLRFLAFLLTRALSPPRGTRTFESGAVVLVHVVSFIDWLIIAGWCVARCDS